MNLRRHKIPLAAKSGGTLNKFRVIPAPKKLSSAFVYGLLLIKSPNNIYGESSKGTPCITDGKANSSGHTKHFYFFLNKYTKYRENARFEGLEHLLNSECDRLYYDKRTTIELLCTHVYLFR